MRRIASVGQGLALTWTIGAVAAGLALGWGWAAGATVRAAEAADAGERAELAKALTGAQVSLAQALAASQREGTPISGKYEMEEGKLQLSVYTEKDGKFSEVIVDHHAGTVGKVEPITGGEDLAAATAQAAAMAKARRSLQAAVAEAARANTGFRVVSVMPVLENGHAMADLTLVKGTEWKTMRAKLD